jgi:hypothetical protein
LPQIFVPFSVEHWPRDGHMNCYSQGRLDLRTCIGLGGVR